jgi:hypothetical protein
MVQQQTTIQWAYEHYFVYLHLCIADSDCVIAECEFDKIKNAVFPRYDEERASQIVKRVYLEFIAHNDFEKRELIRLLAPKFLRTPSIRERVLSALKCITSIEEDGEEQIMYRYIESILGDHR